MHPESPDSSLSGKLDEEGFLVQGEQWSKDIANLLAMKETPSGLGDDHWKVINFLRDYYVDCGSVPPPKMLCR